MKHLAQYFKGKSFNVLGLNLPKIKTFSPIDLPIVLAKELRLDNLFELEDDSLLLVDYESTYKREKFVEYLLYVALVLGDYLRQKGEICTIHVVIIYTADMATAPKTLDTGAVRMEVEQVFLSQFDGDAIFAELLWKVETCEALTDEDLIRFSLLPLTEPKPSKKQPMIEKTVELAKCVTNEEQ
jgi:hypothetical protein